MKGQHLTLVVEDQPETAEDLVEILRSIGCDSFVVDNRDGALTALQTKSFCLILLDLQIKSAADSIKGHVEHGKALLRDIRQKYGEHNGTAFWLPVIIVSGFAREADEAVDVMKDGANDVIQKPLRNQQVSERIRHALEASGRQTHELCQEPPPAQRPNLSEGIVIGIPGDRIRRRTRVTVASRPLNLPNSSLKVLLHLLVAKQSGSSVHKTEMGATAEQGFRGISTLRSDLNQVLGGVDIIENDYQGNYNFTDRVVIGECVVKKTARDR